MATEREYREWQRRNQKKVKRRRQNGSNHSILYFFIICLSFGLVVKQNPDFLSFISNQSNSLRSLTKEFVIEIDEPIVNFSSNNFESVNFDSIDKLAKSVPYNGDSTTELAQTLSSFANSDLEKARIIYTWITHNIIYDVPALDNLFNNDIYPDVRSQTVLQNKSTICSGYAN